MEKYSEQDSGIEFNDGISLAKSINPYASRPTKVKGMKEKLAEEESYNNFNNLRKFLGFYRIKSDIIIRLVKEFTNNSYPNLKNVYKYLLMFLSLCGFICRISYHLKQIKNKKISTPDGQIAIADLSAEHAAEAQNLFNEFAGKHEASLKKFQGVLEKQINVKILGTYLKRAEEEAIIKKCSNMGDFVSLIERSNKRDFDSEEDYMLIYSKLMNHPEVHVRDEAIEDLSEADLKTYLFIRVIGNIDDIFLNASYKVDDYLRIKKQDIENKDKAGTSAFIKSWNKK